MVRNKSTVAWAATLGLLAGSPALAEDDQPAAAAAAVANEADEGAGTVQDVQDVTEAQDEAAEEAFPVSGSLALTYRFNHANFVDNETGDADFGYQFMWLDAGVGYDITKSIGVSASFTVEKELNESFDRAPTLGGSSTRTVRQTQLRDVSLGASWSKFATIPVVDISFSAGLGFDFPTSKASQSAGTLLITYPSISAAWSWNDLSLSAAFAYFYYLNENPTVEIDCTIAPQNCEVSGQDTGNPNALHTLLLQTGISYAILDDLSVSMSYLLTNSYGAVEFPDDEFTSEFAQTGQQEGVGVHGTDFRISYRLFENTRLTAAMATRRSLFTNDGKDRTQPFYDSDSDLHHRTYYYFTLAQSI
jgi:hypothetical protein